MADNKTTANANHQRITDEDWNAMVDRREALDRDIEEALERKSLRMTAIALNERAHLSASLKKAHNMRERDVLASYRKRLDELKQEMAAPGEAMGEAVEEEAAS